MRKNLVTTFFFAGFSFIALGEPMNGPLPEEQRSIIHELAQRHTELKRKVKEESDAYQKGLYRNHNDSKQRLS